MRTTVFLLLVSAALLASDYLFAAEYEFTGNGSWSDSANWRSRQLPTYVGKDDVVRIKGNAVVMENCDLPTGDYDCDPYSNDIQVNSGTIVIESGGSLMLKNYAQFMQMGVIVVHGTMINRTNLEGYDISTIIVHGTFKNQGWVGNQGTFTIENGGELSNEGGVFDNKFVYQGTLVLKAGGTIKNNLPARLNLGIITNEGGTIQNSSSLGGNAIVKGNLENSGTLAPGSSPGTYTINGNYTANNSAKHNFEIGGIDSGAYDLLSASGTVALAGPLTVSLINNFKPATDHEITIISGSINGTFSTATIPSGYQLEYRPNAVVLQYATVLPVTFSGVFASHEGKAVRLTWQVQHETDVKQYEVERSNDGGGYSKISTIQAQQSITYHFTDYQPSSKNFYRIKSVDIDGKISYSKIVAIDHNREALTVFPWQAKHQFKVRHTVAGPGSFLNIMSIDGKLLETVYPARNARETIVNLFNYAPGIYILRYTNGTGRSETLKVLK